MAEVPVAGVDDDRKPTGGDVPAAGADAAAPADEERRPYVGIGTLLSGDGVRGVGALFVFTTHVCLLADPDPDNNLASFGWAAPVLGHIDLALSAFFVLSGYLIARPYARAYVAGTRRPRLSNYARNRVLRVVPAFYFFTILVLLRFGLDGSLESGAAAPEAQSSVWQVLGQFAFIQGQTAGPASIPIGPAWSIGAEVGFYIVIPIAAAGAYLVARRLRDQHARVGVALALIGLVFVVSIALRAYDKYLFAWLTSPPAIMYGFMPGVALGILEPVVAKHLRDRGRLTVNIARVAFVLAFVCAVLYTISDYDPRQTPIHHALGQRAMLAALCCGLLFAGLIVMQIGTGRAPRVFGNKAMTWLGARSYSFYLVHIWVLLEIEYWLLNADDGIPMRLAIMGILGFALTVAVGALTYRYVEMPFLERKKRVVPGTGPAGGSADKPQAADPVPVAVDGARS